MKERGTGEDPPGTERWRGEDGAAGGRDDADGGRDGAAAGRGWRRGGRDPPGMARTQGRGWGGGCDVRTGGRGDAMFF